MSNSTLERTAPAASLPKRRRKSFSMDRRPGFLAYGILIAFLVGSTYPLWYSFIIGSSSGAVFASAYPPLLPGGQFWTNVAEVLDSIHFWSALGNSLIVSSVITFSVVSFSTLAGYAFAKLRFRGREGLLVFVIATLAV
ncbi:MAG: carbohydrate ABC transporter permease, partial [Glutamicibacter arilaitensis]